MDGRERFLTAINNEKPDRLPCQVHSWMGFYLSEYLGGMDSYAAYDRFGMDPVIYTGAHPQYNEADFPNWRYNRKDQGLDADGNHHYEDTIETPGGTLRSHYATNPITGWNTEHLIKTEADFELWNKYLPAPIGFDWAPTRDARQRIGNRGIVRGGLYDFGQGSPWQSLCILMGTVECIYAAMDRPQWMHYALDAMLQKKLRAIELMAPIELDLVETGGGAGSCTVISPDLFREFLLPYDKIQHKAIHEAGAKIVYHLCGGVMGMLDLVVENGADGLETMTPPSMGGDCDLAEASRRVGDKLFFIGGFDQNAGFEKGTPDEARRLVRECHAACPDGGYICCPSDHFFHGAPENIEAFVDEAKSCAY